ncbi:Nucleoredoxin [Frankliniella fusca]|uniref:Nucleoredoxin n=1 Tax=Frankliniella fusca TaxID=407009 RepID=A0AAE1I4G6_9NEOP|nr:Nucleoredoxin [Frankliniella fusca]
MENFCGSKPPEGGCGSRQAQGFYPLWQPTASVFHGNRRFADCDPIAQFDRFDPRTTIGLPLERRLCGRYRVRADVALSRLLLVDARSGRLVSRCGRERLLADPKGLAFPWPARPLAQVLASAALQQGPGQDGPGRGRALLDELGSAAGPGHGPGHTAVLGVYFSAHWCPPCKAFTPQLVNTYNAVRERGHSFEVIFVSSDR